MQSKILDTNYKDYCKKAIKLYRYYKGEVDELMEDYISEHFQDPSEVSLTPRNFTNLVKNIIDMRSKTMNNIKINFKNDSDEKKFREILSRSGTNFLLEANQMAELFKKVNITVAKDKKSKDIRLELLNPFELQAELEEERYFKEGKVLSWNWDSSTMTVKEKKEKLQSDDLITIQIDSPYKTKYYPPLRETLLRAQESINFLLFIINHQVKYQAYSQPVGKDVEVDDFDSDGTASQQKVVGTNKLVRVGENGDYKFASPDTKLGELNKSLENQLVTILSEYGISKESYTLQNNPTSGYALLLKNQQLHEYNDKKADIYINFLWRLFRKLKDVTNINEPESIEYKTPGVRLQETEKIKKEEHDLRYNLTSPVRILMERKGIDKEKAIELIEEYKEENSKYKQTSVKDMMRMP